MKEFSSKRTTKTDCRWYRGYIPCKPHKQTGCLCDVCSSYEPLKERILIIKLGAAGDVIRTTPLLRCLKKEYPNAEITWLTYFPDFVPRGRVDKVLKFELKSITWLKMQDFDWLINLDKDDEAIALSAGIKAKKKSGFGMDSYGKCRPLASESETHKWLTGIWDDINKANTMTYMEEIFAICGFRFNDEEYILEKAVNKEWGNIDRTKNVIGLNTGCGARWTSRLWRDELWIELARDLKGLGHEVILLGGPDEDKKNKRIAEMATVKYLGCFDFPTFIDLIDQCDVIVTQVTMAMHIAIGLKKTLILMNNIFNRNEFYLYGNGCIVEPDLDCLNCFKPQFDDKCPVSNCMDMIGPEKIIEAIKRSLKKEVKART